MTLREIMLKYLEGQGIHCDYEKHSEYKVKFKIIKIHFASKITKQNKQTKNQPAGNI